MAKFLIKVKIVETYESNVLVEADSPGKAEEKVNQAYEDDTYIYDKTTESLTDQNVKFFPARKAEDCGNVHRYDIIDITD